MMVYSFLVTILVMSHFCNQMSIPSVNLNNINLDSNFDDDDPNTIVPLRLSASHSKFKKRKALEKQLNEELMLAA